METRFPVYFSSSRSFQLNFASSSSLRVFPNFVVIQLQGRIAVTTFETLFEWILKLISLAWILTYTYGILKYIRGELVHEGASLSPRAVVLVFKGPLHQDKVSVTSCV